MKNPPPGKEWMGLTKSQMMQGAKAYKFKKSAGASASAKRFGTDEEAPRRLPKPAKIGGKRPNRIPAVAGPAREDYISGKKEYQLPRNLGKTPFGPKGGKRSVGQRVPRIKKGR